VHDDDAALCQITMSTCFYFAASEVVANSSCKSNCSPTDRDANPKSGEEACGGNVGANATQERNGMTGVERCSNATDDVEHLGSEVFIHCRYVREFSSESARLKSFENGRVGDGQSAQALSTAGFFYVGTTIRCS